MIQRQEEKYLLEYNQLSFILSKFNAFQKYPSRTVNSIYFDTNMGSSFSDSDDGVVPRSKYRFRWYGDKIFIPKNGLIEIKNTYDHYKDKESIAFNYVNFNDVLVFLSAKVNLALHERCQISYIRSYFETNDGLRFTYDYNIQVRRLRNDIFINIPTNIFEIKYQSKTTNNLFQNIMGDRKTRFSKYNFAMEKLGY